MGRCMINIPLEDDEIKYFHQWLELKKIPHSHIPNEVGGSSQAVKMRAIKMKRLGTSKGFPDLIVLVPIKGVTGHVDTYQMLAIEMKRKKGSTVSPEQKQWIKMLELAGIPSRICRGADEAIEFVKEYML